MKRLKFCIVGVLLASSLAVPLLIHRRAAAKQEATNDSLRRHAIRVAALTDENQRLSDGVAQAKISQSLSGAEMMELLALRNEVGQLRGTLGKMDQLRHEMDRIREAMQDLTKTNEGGGILTLLEDEKELRQGRVNQLKQWFASRPEEWIPELKLTSEDDWWKSADWQRVTDDDYRGWMSMKRAGAETAFSRLAFDALKQYAQANGGRFPTELAQLKPYFTTPVDDAILERWQIVPAKSLIPFLAEAGGDWVITQKTPVNKELDQCIAISVTTWRGTLQDGRWGPAR